MPAMSLRAVNLNLIPVLHALLRERNLSRAAKSLGLTQPAVSGALARLRILLGDPLLVREGRGMVLTLRAHELLDAVEQVCASLEDIVGSERFDPASSQRRFVIASADYAVIAVAPQILRELERVAPAMSVHFIDVPHSSLEPNAGEVDLFIVPELLLQNSRYPPMRWTTLIEDEFVTVVRAKSGSDSELHADLSSMRYAMYYPALTSIDASMQTAISGRVPPGRDVPIHIQQFSLLPTLVLETGCAAIMPRRIAHYMASYLPIRIVDVDQPPVSLQLAIAWYASNEHDPAHRWFRKLIIERCTQLDETMAM